jgi:transmembrane sensor
MVRRESAEEIDDVAASWAARLDREPLSPEEQQSLDSWLDEDPRRRGALARALAILEHFDCEGTLGPRFDPWMRRRMRRPASLGRREFLAGGAIAAGIGAAGVILPGWLQQTRRFSTAMGEVRAAPLGDGSVVWLNTDTDVKVDYGRSRRRAWLLAGEAIFEVAGDPARPFVVRVDGLDVLAAAASFSVSRLAGRPVEVIVREGLVDLGRGAARSRLTAGMRALAPASGPVRVSRLGPEEVLRALSWRQGMLDFDGETLAEAAAIFARYSDRRIVIDDPDLARRSVAGRFASTNPVGFAQAVALGMNLRVRTAPGTVHLSR